MCQSRLRSQSSPRRAEVLLEQLVPEADVDIDAERAPKGLDRGRQLQRASRITLTGLRHCNPLHLDTRLEDVTEFERRPKAFPVAVLRLDGVAANQRAVGKEVNCEVPRPNVVFASIEELVREGLSAFHFAE